MSLRLLVLFGRGDEGDHRHQILNYLVWTLPQEYTLGHAGEWWETQGDLYHLHHVWQVTISIMSTSRGYDVYFWHHQDEPEIVSSTRAFCHLQPCIVISELVWVTALYVCMFYQKQSHSSLPIAVSRVWMILPIKSYLLKRYYPIMQVIDLETQASGWNPCWLCSYSRLPQWRYTRDGIQRGWGHEQLMPYLFNYLVASCARWICSRRWWYFFETMHGLHIQWWWVRTQHSKCSPHPWLYGTPSMRYILILVYMMYKIIWIDHRCCMTLI